MATDALITVATGGTGKVINKVANKVVSKVSQHLDDVVDDALDVGFLRISAKGEVGEALSSKTVNPSELIPTQPITKSRKQMKRLKQDIADNGINQSIKYVERDGKNILLMDIIDKKLQKN